MRWLIAGLVLTVSVVAVQAATLSVPAQYATVQAAIDAAVAGDVVIVARGTYRESLDFKGRAITVRSTAPTNPAVVAATVLRGAGSTVVEFSTGETAASVLSGFTITGGIGHPIGEWGGEFSASRSVTPKIGSDELRNAGGGIYCEDSSPTLSYNRITGNAVGGEGGGVYSVGGSPRLASNEICGNETSDGWSAWQSLGGGGVFIERGTPVLVNNHIWGNVTHQLGEGGGVCATGCNAVLKNNEISGNSSSCGGGVSLQWSLGSQVLTNNTITGNSAYGVGGGVDCELTSAVLTSNTIAGNTARDGAGIYYWGDTGNSLKLKSNDIANNQASASAGFGGGVCIQRGSALLSRNTIRSNSAYAAGGLYCCDAFHEAFTVTVYYCLIYGNRAVRGGGVRCDQCSPVLTNVTISRNTATRAGGGVYCYNGASPQLTNTIVFGNLGCGGLWCPTVSGSPVVTYCDFYGNVGGNFVGLPDPAGTSGNIHANPLFANAAAGDFHEKSKGGRWDPVGQAWIVDTVQSPCIDTGDPRLAFASEPAPNGGRINMGAYGNTAEASKAAPASTAALVSLTASASGTAQGAAVTVNLTAAANVQTAILNLAGRVVATLPEQACAAGTTTLLWSGRSAGGTLVPNGTYLLRVTARAAGGAQASALASCCLRR